MVEGLTGRAPALSTRHPGVSDLDILDEATRTGVEANGVYWHSEKNSRQSRTRHRKKFRACRTAGIRLIQVWEDDWALRRAAVENGLRRMLAPAAAVAVHDVVLASAAAVQPFRDEFDLVPDEPGETFVAMRDVGGTLVAVAVLSGLNERVARLVRYVVRSDVIEPMPRLVGWLEETFPAWEELEAEMAHDWPDNEPFMGEGWEFVRELDPRARYLVRSERRREHSGKSAPNRCWDSGASLYRLRQLRSLGLTA